MAIRIAGLGFGLRRLERSARMVMGGVAIVAMLVGMSFKAGLLSTAAVYDRQSWYLISEHGNVVLTSQVDDEAACRKRESASAMCRSGASMMDQKFAVGMR